jgi:flagellar biosynthesis/type III secretory pathway protein FliH
MLYTIARRHALPAAVAGTLAGRVVSCEMLGSVRRTQDLMAAAEHERLKILEAARAEAEILKFEAIRDAQRSVWQCAHGALALLHQLHQQWVAQAEPMLAQVAHAALHRLMIDVPPDWPAMSSVRLILQQWHGDGQACLHLNPSEVGEVERRIGNGVRCSFVSDDAVAPGECVLVCGQAELRASFSANLRGLLDALGALPHELVDSACQPKHDPTIT